MGAATWLAHTATSTAACSLRARETERGAALLTEAEALAERRSGCRPSSPGSARSAPDAGPPLPDGLSAREVDVLRLVARGLSNREIGAALFISEHTAANHMRSILRKTGCANRTEATAYAYRSGLAQS